MLQPTSKLVRPSFHGIMRRITSLVDLLNSHPSAPKSYLEAQICLLFIYVHKVTICHDIYTNDISHLLANKKIVEYRGNLVINNTKNCN